MATDDDDITQDQPARMRALSIATREWIAAGLEGDELAPAVAEILIALQRAIDAGDVAALRAKLGPERWAHGYIVDRMQEADYSLSPRRDDAARAFVRYVESRMYEPPAVLAQLGALWLQMDGRFGGLVSEPQEANPTPRMLEAIRRVQHRESYDAKALAVAMLQGWGLTRDKARDLLKNKDV